MKVTRQVGDNLTAKFDLTLTVRETRGTLDFEFEYCTALFKENTLRRFFLYIRQVAAAVVENPGMKIGDIDIAHDLLPAGAGIDLTDLEF